MTKLPRDVPGDRLVRALGQVGWYEDHQVGSHVTLRHPEMPGRKVVVPVHPGRPLKLGTLHRNLREAGMTVEALRGLL